MKTSHPPPPIPSPSIQFVLFVAIYIPNRLHTPTSSIDGGLMTVFGSQCLTFNVPAWGLNGAYFNGIAYKNGA